MAHVLFDINENVRGKEVRTLLFKNENTIVQLQYEDGSRINTSVNTDQEIGYFFGAVTAIFRIHPFKGNLL